MNAMMYDPSAFRSAVLLTDIGQGSITERRPITMNGLNSKRGSLAHQAGLTPRYIRKLLRYPTCE